MPTLSASGVDTVSFGYRPADDAPLDAFLTREARPGPAGSLVLKQRGADGGRAIAFRSHGLIAYETRLGALLAGDDDCYDLVAAGGAAAGADAAREALGRLLGSDPGGRVEVRRFDLASELCFEDGASGLAFLGQLRGLCPPRAKINAYSGADGQVQTVNVVTAKRGKILSRAYDKGVESGSHPAGLRVRIESQNRPAKSARYSPLVFSSLDLAPTYGRTMSHYLHSDEIVSAGIDGATAHLVAKAATGELSVTRATRLAGDIAFLKYAGRAAMDNPAATAKANNNRSARRLKALRDAGITLDDELPADAVVPVSELLRDAVESFRA